MRLFYLRSGANVTGTIRVPWLAIILAVLTLAVVVESCIAHFR